jgi:hypothetical protein
VVEASASGSSDAVAKSSVAASRMWDAVHASTDEPYSGFLRKALTEASEA